MGSYGHKQMLHATRIDLPVERRAQIVALLNQTLAFTLDLKTQVKQAHWNVKGLDFYQLHELFGELAGELEECVDLVAERVAALGGMATGTAHVAAQVSELPEYPYDLLDGKDHVVALADRYATQAKVHQGIAKTDELSDADTAALCTEVLRAIDKRLWFLEAPLQAAVVDSGNVSTSGSTKATAGKIKAKAKAKEWALLLRLTKQTLRLT